MDFRGLGGVKAWRLGSLGAWGHGGSEARGSGDNAGAQEIWVRGGKIREDGVCSQPNRLTRGVLG